MAGFIRTGNNRRIQLQAAMFKLLTRRINTTSRIVLCCCALVLYAAPAAAQTTAQRKSEHGTLSQELHGTKLTLEYDRPLARGRDSLFGGVVKWDEVWTPGANWATTFEVDKDVQLNGHPVPKGKYSVWMIPRAEGEWTVFLHKKNRVFHTQKPKDSSDDVVRFTVAPQAAEFFEALTWYIPAITGTVMTLRMQWGETAVPLQITVEASKSSN